MNQALKFKFKPAPERAKATFAKRHNRVFSCGDQDKETLRRYLDEVSALRSD
jgi:hypothetical protein